VSEPRYYVVLATDNPGMVRIRQQVRPAHRDYLRGQSHVQIFSAGPLLDEGGVMNGTFALCGAGSRDRVERFVAGDPYSQSGLFAEVIIRRLNWTLRSSPPTQSDIPKGTAEHDFHSFR
jgi:uncharacterized protein